MQGGIWCKDPGKLPSIPPHEVKVELDKYWERKDQIEIPWEEWGGAVREQLEIHRVTEISERVRIPPRASRAVVLAELRKEAAGTSILERVNWYDLIVEKGIVYLLAEAAKISREKQTIKVSVVVHGYNIIQFYGFTEEHIGNILSHELVTHWLSKYRNQYCGLLKGTDVRVLLLYRGLLVLMYGDKNVSEAEKLVEKDTAIASVVEKNYIHRQEEGTIPISAQEIAEQLLKERQEIEEQRVELEKKQEELEKRVEQLQLEASASKEKAEPRDSIKAENKVEDKTPPIDGTAHTQMMRKYNIDAPTDFPNKATSFDQYSFRLFDNIMDSVRSQSYGTVDGMAHTIHRSSIAMLRESLDEKATETNTTAPITGQILGTSTLVQYHQYIRRKSGGLKEVVRYNI